MNLQDFSSAAREAVDPRRAARLGVGVAAAPIWAAFATAAGVGVAWWLATAWTRRGEAKSFADDGVTHEPFPGPEAVAPEEIMAHRPIPTDAPVEAEAVEAAPVEAAPVETASTEAAETESDADPAAEPPVSLAVEVEGAPTVDPVALGEALAADEAPTEQAAVKAAVQAVLGESEGADEPAAAPAAIVKRPRKKKG